MLHQYPFLRLLFPFALGIFCGDEIFYQGQFGGTALFYGVLPVAFVLLLALYFLKRYAYRWCFGVVLFFFGFIAGGARISEVLQAAKPDFPAGQTVYMAVITDRPEMKGNTVLCRVRLGQIDSVTHKPSRSQKVLLYLSKDSLSERLMAGDEMLARIQVSAPRNNGNPDEFDYARFLLRRQVSGIGFVASGNWKLLSHDALQSFQKRALDFRESILSLYRELSFQGDDFAVLSALTVGYKEELSEDIRETYSVSGASHVLALSGLHIGFLYALLLFCLRWLPGHGRISVWVKTLFIVSFLWAFAFFTGLSASVVRSVMMFSLFALAGGFQRKSFSLNTLMATAFIMLVCQPSWLFDVGFQLSFCAVAAILLIQPRMYRLLPVNTRAGKYVWGLMTVSIAAQVGTAPLILFYFSRFSTHFLLTNLLVIPLVTIIMYSAVLMLLLTPLPILQAWFAVGVKTLIGVLNDCVRWVEQLPYASLDGIWVYRFEVLGGYLLVFLLLRYFSARTAKNLLVCLSCFLLIGLYHGVMQMNDRPRQSIVFYNVRHCPVVHCIAVDGRSWLTYADCLPDTNRLCRAVSGHWNRLHLKTPQTVLTDYKENCFSCKNHIISFSGCRVCLVSDDRWRNKTVSQPLNIDYLYLCEGYKGQLKELSEVFHIRHVILDSSLAEYRRQAYKEECRQMKLHFISLADEGSVSIML